MSVDVLADFFTVIRNGFSIGRRSVIVYSSKEKVRIAQVLMDEGYIKDYKVEETGKGKFILTVFLKYVGGKSVINEITRVSKPSRRCYEKRKAIESVAGGLGTSILSTSFGIMTGRNARKAGMGGEVICRVW